MFWSESRTNVKKTGRGSVTFRNTATHSWHWYLVFAHSLDGSNCLPVSNWSEKLLSFSRLWEWWSRRAWWGSSSASWPGPRSARPPWCSAGTLSSARETAPTVSCSGETSALIDDCHLLCLFVAKWGLVLLPSLSHGGKDVFLTCAKIASLVRQHAAYLAGWEF